MRRIIPTMSEYVRKTPRAKIPVARATGKGINTSSNYFPDGGLRATALLDAANNLESALNRFDLSPSDLNRSLVKDAKIECDMEMTNCLGYVKSKCNAVNDAELATVIIAAAALTVRKKKSRRPAPDRVEKAVALFSKIPQTILLKIKKKPKYADFFQIWISQNPDAENSWTFIDSTCDKQLLVKGLTTGQYYYLRIIACNKYGKTLPAITPRQMAA